MVESGKSKIKVLNGISVNVYGGENLKTKSATAGIGIEKKVIDFRDLIKVGIGAYATKDLEKMLDWSRPDISFGASFTMKF